MILIKFFDTIDLCTLINKAVEVDFPIFDLRMTMLQNMAPRIIQCQGFCSRAIITNTSILAIMYTHVYICHSAHSRMYTHVYAHTHKHARHIYVYTHDVYTP